MYTKRQQKKTIRVVNVSLLGLLAGVMNVVKLGAGHHFTFVPDVFGVLFDGNAVLGICLMQRGLWAKKAVS